jgi:cyclopropane-fatty-acyl-phospholipid synthase
MHRERAAGLIRDLVEGLTGSSLPVRVRAWDGSQVGPEGGPTLVVRNRRALRHTAWAPGHLGLTRAYVSGDLDIDGDVLDFLRAFLEAPPSRAARSGLRRWSHLAGSAIRLGAVGPRPAPPPEEMPRRRGSRHSKERDAAVVIHHYDVGNDFYRIVLGDSMVYSCAYFREPAQASFGGAALDEAQAAKLALVCRKLALQPGQRLLDVGCGWGSLVLHAAREHGVTAVGVTLSPAQADLARDRVREAGLSDRVEIRVQDYRDVDDGPYDAIASIGMAEHVGRREFTAYAAHLRALLRPGGRLLNHMIATHEDEHPSDPFIDAYVFPDGELIPLGVTVSALETTGLEVRDVHVLREHYILTLKHWLARLERGWDDAVAETGEGRARVWRLYMAAAALGFERRRLGVNQVLAVRPTDNGNSEMPLVFER